MFEAQKERGSYIFELDSGIAHCPLVFEPIPKGGTAVRSGQGNNRVAIFGMKVGKRSDFYNEWYTLMTVLRVGCVKDVILTMKNQRTHLQPQANIHCVGVGFPV
jgi:hypothetical protein